MRCGWALERHKEHKRVFWALRGGERLYRALESEGKDTQGGPGGERDKERKRSQEKRHAATHKCRCVAGRHATQGEHRS